MATIVQRSRTRLRHGYVVWLPHHLVFLAVAFLVLIPVGMLVWGSFRNDSPFVATAYTLQGYRDTLFARDTWELAWTTLWLSVVRTAGAAGLAIFLAWAIHRTDTPLRGLFDKLIYARFFVPNLPILMAWVLLLSPRSGLINQFGTNYLGLSGPIMNIFSYQGIILTSVLGWSSLLYIFISPAFMRMDRTLEEASVICGAGRFQTLRRVTAPLLKPAILAVVLLAFIRMVESFETELLLGIPAGIVVFTTKIYLALEDEPPVYNVAMAFSMILMVMTIGLAFLYWRMLGNREYTTVSGKAYQAQPTPLGPFKWVVFTLIVIFLIVDWVLPVGALLLGTFMKIAGVWGAGFTVSHWTTAFDQPIFMRALRNTLLMASASATGAVLLSSLVAYIVIRTRYPGRRAMEFVTWLPWAVPGLVLSLGFFWSFVIFPFMRPLFGTIWIMVLLFMTRGFPIGTRIMSSSIIQIHRELEESSRISGAGWFTTYVRILVPLLLPGLLSAWILLFTFAVRDLSSVILLYGARSEVLSTVIWRYQGEGGQLEVGYVYGVIQALIVAVVFAVLKLATRFGRVAA